MRWTYGGYLRRVKVSELVGIIEKAVFFQLKVILGLILGHIKTPFISALS